MNNINNLKGIKTSFFSDVKIKIKAGMPFGSNDYKLRVIGYDLFRLYFDTDQKDMQIGSERIKRVINI